MAAKKTAKKTTKKAPAKKKATTKVKKAPAKKAPAKAKAEATEKLRGEELLATMPKPSGRGRKFEDASRELGALAKSGYSLNACKAWGCKYGFKTKTGKAWTMGANPTKAALIEADAPILYTRAEDAQRGIDRGEPRAGWVGSSANKGWAPPKGTVASVERATRKGDDDDDPKPPSGKAPASPQRVAAAVAAKVARDVAAPSVDPMTATDLVAEAALENLSRGSLVDMLRTLLKAERRPQQRVGEPRRARKDKAGEG